jgi:hypothetical protein
MSVYANGLTIHMNEIAYLEFTENMQSHNGPVARIAIQYEALKQMHAAIGDAIMQHDARLSELSKARSTAH